jgi:hypothetical protein
MSRLLSVLMFAVVGVAAASVAHGQAYVGFVYPAGGQQGTTVPIRLGGQRLDGVHSAIVSGSGVEAKVVDYWRWLNNQEIGLMRENQRQLRNQLEQRRKRNPRPNVDETTQKVWDRIEPRIGEWVNTPANRSLANLVFLDVTISPDAAPGPREIRLVTGAGITNPMTFHVSQFPEASRPPRSTWILPILGKEEGAEPKRPPEEVEMSVNVPCVVNGQIAAGAVDHYRFEAQQGERLVISTYARHLVPYIADAVPGWFQPVITLYNAEGREVGYNDDYRFKPDSVLYFEVPEDGQYVLTISDALFRGREDFVYRITIAERPYLTSVFPLGGRVGEPFTAQMQGWNLEDAQLSMPPTGSKPGIYYVTASKAGVASNRMPLAIGTLAEVMEQEPNNDRSQATKVQLPVVINGRINEPGDWDVFQFEGRAGETIVAEVMARRLDSPLDSLLKLTDAAGNILALNDDYEDPGTGLNTHHADSYLMIELPADGTYFVHLSDTTHHGGEEYAYRLRLSPPQPDFSLRVVPSGGGVRSKGSVTGSVYAVRKDGFTGDIRVNLKDPSEGFLASPVIIKNNQELVRFSIRTSLTSTPEPVRLTIQGTAKVGDQELTRDAQAADDRMQAFLWRHLVTAEDLVVMVYNPSSQPLPTRVYQPPADPPWAKKPPAGGAPKFTKAQVAGRLRQLKSLYDDWLLTDSFYGEKVAECEAAE